VVPSLYVGVALCGDTGAALAAWSVSSTGVVSVGRALAQFGSAALVLASFVVCADVVRQGDFALENRSARSNYGLDDRSSVRWLLNVHRPGDLVATTHFGLAGLWWYSGTNISNVDHSTHLADGSPLFEIGHVPPEADCQRVSNELNAALRGR